MSEGAAYSDLSNYPNAVAPDVAVFWINHGRSLEQKRIYDELELDNENPDGWVEIPVRHLKDIIQGVPK